MQNNRLEEIFAKQVRKYNLPAEEQKELINLGLKVYNYYLAIDKIEKTTLQETQVFLEYVCIYRAEK